MQSNRSAKNRTHTRSFTLNSSRYVTLMWCRPRTASITFRLTHTHEQVEKNVMLAKNSTGIKSIIITYF